MIYFDYVLVWVLVALFLFYCYLVYINIPDVRKKEKQR